MLTFNLLYGRTLKLNYLYKSTNKKTEIKKINLFFYYDLTKKPIRFFLIAFSTIFNCENNNFYLKKLCFYLNLQNTPCIFSFQHVSC
jgi:hypothetical protein